jgi:hypothetical protein
MGGRAADPVGGSQRIYVLRRVLNPLSPVEAMELLLDKMAKTNPRIYLHVKANRNERDNKVRQNGSPRRRRGRG